jgi:predicted flap endonuclease-1-like 5' DNA nuclease
LPYPIVEIEGMDSSHAEILSSAGIRSTEQLLESCKTPHGRKVTALKTSIAEEQLLRWANIADLSRIRGVAKQYLQLLATAGVLSMRDLRAAKADGLSQLLRQANEEKHLCKVTPSVAVVRKWIDQAKTLGSKVTTK